MSRRRGRRSQWKTARPGRPARDSFPAAARLRAGDRCPPAPWGRLPPDAVARAHGSTPSRCSNDWQFAAPGRREVRGPCSKARFLQLVEEEGAWGAADEATETATRD